MAKHAEIILGDCRQVLKTLEADSFDSMVTDPPAGIAFMGAEWDRHTLDGFEEFLTEVFKEAYRVLKPGAHILVWSLPRTSHRTAMAIERSGFELRDTLCNIKDRSIEVQQFVSSLSTDQLELLARAEPTDSFILHMFGQGFPKNLNVSKAIDKMKGAKREVVGKDPNYHSGGKRGGLSPGQLVTGKSSNQNWQDGEPGTLTAPATPEAAKWEGWGTALKPAVETWWLARKPLKEKTVAEQVLATGTGAINVDGCRVGTDTSREDRYSGKAPGGCQTKLTRSGPSVQDEVWEVKAGRWPANVTLQHGPDCKKIGTKSVKSVGHFPAKLGNSQVYGHFNGGDQKEQWMGEDGKETVEAWNCAPSCPVKALDDQSGELIVGKNSVKRESAKGHIPGAYGVESRPAGTLMVEYGDTGGASRFFNNFEPDMEAPPFFYTGKISGGEREEDKEDGVINNHPTVKARRLMAHLVKLVTPPGGRVLDPFAGSGSTIVAAIREGFDGLGIEKEPEYHAIAQKRVESMIGANTTLGDLMSELGISED